MTEPIDESGQILVNRYVLRRRVACSRYNVVYESQDIVSLQTVAVKLTVHTGAGPIRDLQREAEYLSAFAHPGITELRDVGDLPDGRGFLVTEWIDGVSLDELPRARQL